MLLLVEYLYISTLCSKQQVNNHNIEDKFLFMCPASNVLVYTSEGEGHKHGREDKSSPLILGIVRDSRTELMKL